MSSDMETTRRNFASRGEPVRMRRMRPSRGLGRGFTLLEPAALNARPQYAEKWAGPDLKKPVPTDPWGAPYGYKSPGEHGEYDLMFHGSDHQPGGTGVAADVTSW